MKKHLFILILAVFASVTVAFGQATHSTSNATPVTCANDALHPIAGKAYSYSAQFSPSGGTLNWHIVAGTSTTTFISGGSWVSGIDQTAPGSWVLSTTPGTLTGISPATSPSTVSITWASSGLAQLLAPADSARLRLFVATEYSGPSSASTCNNNNLQVWRIKPKNAFTIDVYNITSAGALTGSGSTVSQCYSNVASAKYDNTAGKVTMDYGTNTITYEIVAANFTGSFSSTVQVSGLQTGQTADVSWGYSVAAAGTTSLGSGSNGTYGPIAATIAANTDTGQGVSVFVQVVVHNNGYEGLTNDGITLAADATDSAGQDDVKVSDCTPETPFADAATHTLQLRPTVNNPNPNPFLQKN